MAMYDPDERARAALLLAADRVDRTTETEQFGELLWGGGTGLRCFARQDGDAYRMRVVGPGVNTLYELPGVRGEWLS